MKMATLLKAYIKLIKKDKLMKHCGTQKLETDRLVLRRYVNEDAEAMYNNWAADEEVTN